MLNRLTSSGPQFRQKWLTNRIPDSARSQAARPQRGDLASIVNISSHLGARPANNTAILLTFRTPEERIGDESLTPDYSCFVLATSCADRDGPHKKPPPGASGGGGA
jgi:hypothetical protein